MFTKRLKHFGWQINATLMPSLTLYIRTKAGQVLDIADSSSQRSHWASPKIVMNALDLSDSCADRSVVYKNI